MEPILNGPAPAARKGASAACTQSRFVVIFGGKGMDADGKEGLKEDLLLLEMDGGPSTIKVSSLDIKGVKPAPRMNAMFQVRLRIMQQASRAWIHDTDKMAESCLNEEHQTAYCQGTLLTTCPALQLVVIKSSNALMPPPLDHALIQLHNMVICCGVRCRNAAQVSSCCMVALELTASL